MTAAPAFSVCQTMPPPKQKPVIPSLWPTPAVADSADRARRRSDTMSAGCRLASAAA